MKSGDVEIKRLKEILKALIQKKGYKYEDLARELKVSLTTVKRMLNNEDLPLSRFFQIMEWLGVSLSEISSLVGDGGRERFPELTDAQEQFLSDHSDHAVILEELMVGRSLESVQKKYKLTAASLQKYLRNLDKANLIELLPNGQVRRLIKNMKVRRGGPFSHRIAERLGTIAKENVEQGLIFGNQSPKFSFHFNTNLWMSKKTLKQLHQEIEELALKYNTIATTEEAVTTLDNLTPVVWFLVVNNTEINHRIFDTPKNFPKAQVI